MRGKMFSLGNKVRVLRRVCPLSETKYWSKVWDVFEVGTCKGVDPESWIFAINEYLSLVNTPVDQGLRIVGFNLEGAAAEWFRWMTKNAGVVSIKTYYPGRRVSLARTTEARLDDQAAPMAGTSSGLEVNKVVNNGNGKVKVLNWVQQAIDVESTFDNNARDQASELETKVLMDGKQDEAKVVKVVGVADEQNSDEPNVLEGNGVIGVGVNENN
ncbi:hypothetical protein Tco_1103264 [Tanacetum coccineum]